MGLPLVGSLSLEEGLFAGRRKEIRTRGVKGRNEVPLAGVDSTESVNSFSIVWAMRRLFDDRCVSRTTKLLMCLVARVRVTLCLTQPSALPAIEVDRKRQGGKDA